MHRFRTDRRLRRAALLAALLLAPAGLGGCALDEDAGGVSTAAAPASAIGVSTAAAPTAVTVRPGRVATRRLVRERRALLRRQARATRLPQPQVVTAGASSRDDDDGSGWFWALVAAVGVLACVGVAGAAAVRGGVRGGGGAGAARAAARSLPAALCAGLGVACAVGGALALGIALGVYWLFAALELGVDFGDFREPLLISGGAVALGIALLVSASLLGPGRAEGAP